MSEVDALVASAPNDEDLGLTLLWGTWELWSDLSSGAQSNSFGADSSPAGAHSTAARRAGITDPERWNWLNQVRSIGLFDSAEGFWGLFNCVLLPSQLPPNSSYYLFRRNIAPMWEHEANRRGGKWVMPFTHVTTPADAVEPAAEGTLPVDVAWLKLCLAVVGEQLPGGETEICGVTVSRGKQWAGNAHGEWKLCLWTRTANNEETQLSIAHYVKDLLKAGTASSVSLSPAKPSGGQSPEKGEGAAGMTMTFVAHRALMEAKQLYAQGSHPIPSLSPLYTL